MAMGLTANERRDFIYRYAHENQIALYEELASLLNVSHMTIRRDVQLMEQEGKVRRVNGGIRLSVLLHQELPYQDKSCLNHRLKKSWVNVQSLGFLRAVLFTSMQGRPLSKLPAVFRLIFV